jgi:hypothetical protein
VVGDKLHEDTHSSVLGENSDTNGIYTHDEKGPLISLKRKRYPTSGYREGLDELMCVQGLYEERELSPV